MKREVAVLVAAFWSVLATAPALAHASLLSTDPADGAVISSAPSRLLLNFNEPVSPLVFRLVDGSGGTTVVEPTANGPSVAVPLPPGLKDGTRALSWRVVSLDGHPVGGTVVFSIGAPSASPRPAAQSRTDPLAAAATWSLSVILYIGLFVGTGGSFFLAWLAPGLQGGSRTAIASALTAGLLATPLLVGLQGADALELTLSGLSDASAWKTGFSTSLGATALTAAVALIAGSVALAAMSLRAARVLAFFGVLAAGLAPALSGHASSASPQWLTRPAVFIHALSLVLWVGSLLPLGAFLAHHSAPGIVLARFSKAIPWAVGPLLASGVVLAVVQVETPRALLTTTYGQILCVKLVLVALLVAIAAWNRVRLTPAVMGGTAAPRRTLARLIVVEVAIVAVILGLVATWRFTPPPRALLAASARPVHVHVHTANAMADVTFRPSSAGAVAADISLLTRDFGELDAKEVTLTLGNRGAGIELISRPATRGSDGTWRIQSIPVPVNGRWSVQVEILINDFEKVTLEDQVELDHAR